VLVQEGVEVQSLAGLKEGIRSLASGASPVEVSAAGLGHPGGMVIIAATEGIEVHRIVSGFLFFVISRSPPHNTDTRALMPDCS
jgi:hypothetical protein